MRLILLRILSRISRSRAASLSRQVPAQSENRSGGGFHRDHAITIAIDARLKNPQWHAGIGEFTLQRIRSRAAAVKSGSYGNSARILRIPKHVDQVNLS